MLQDVEKHREVAVEYLKYFEDTLLPSKTSDAPKGTRLERVEVLHCIMYNSCSSLWRCLAMAVTTGPELYSTPVSRRANGYDVAAALLPHSLCDFKLFTYCWCIAMQQGLLLVVHNAGSLL